MNRFLQPMSEGRAPHACPSQSGSDHESSNNLSSNQEASDEEKRPLPPQKRRVVVRTRVRREEIVVIAERSVVVAEWLSMRALQTVVVMVGAVCGPLEGKSGD